MFTNLAQDILVQFHNLWHQEVHCPLVQLMSSNQGTVCHMVLYPRHIHIGPFQSQNIVQYKKELIHCF